MTSKRLGFSGYVENISETLEGLILNGTKQDLKLKKKTRQAIIHFQG